MNHLKGESLNVGFDRGNKLEFHGTKMTSDGGLLVYHELDDVLGLFDSIFTNFHDNHTARKINH